MRPRYLRRLPYLTEVIENLTASEVKKACLSLHARLVTDIHFGLS